MSISGFLNVLVALALIFAPSAAWAAPKPAPAAKTGHEMTMTGSAHCDSMPAQPGDHEASDKSCCGAMCMAVAVVPSAPVAHPHAPRMAATSSAFGSLDGLPSELATPPPRRA